MRAIAADVYKKNELVGHIARTELGTSFFYREEYLQDNKSPVATTLPLQEEPYEYPAGALAPFFTGLLPEGRRLTSLRTALKTSADDELSLLLGVGEDTVGDVRVVSPGKDLSSTHTPFSKIPPLADFSTIRFSDFLTGAGVIDPASIPGVQEKVSGKMLTIPLRGSHDFYLLKLNPPEYPRVVENESFFLKYAQKIHSRTGVVESQLVHDCDGASGLLIKRFDRGIDADGNLIRYAVEDACQLLNLYPSEKYNVSAERVTKAISDISAQKIVTAQEILRQFIFSWLTGNGDLHAKNLSVISLDSQRWQLSPIYDIPSTAPYGDKTMALTISNKSTGLSPKIFINFAESIGVKETATRRLIKTILSDTEALIDECSCIQFDSHRHHQLIKLLKNRRLTLSQI